jgi:hypothetical protein
MENYVVRIYRRSSDNPEHITGVVEKPEKGENKPFKTKEEFYNIFWPSLMQTKSTKLKNTLEFRKYRRFLIKKGTLLFDSTTDVGKVIDLSIAGLSFICPNMSIVSEAPFEIGIFVGDNNFYTNKITCKLVKNNNKPNKLHIKKGQDHTNRHSVKFKNLSPKQTAQLRYIIQNFSIGDA